VYAISKTVCYVAEKVIIIIICFPLFLSSLLFLLIPLSLLLLRLSRSRLFTYYFFIFSLVYLLFCFILFLFYFYFFVLSRPSYSLAHFMLFFFYCFVCSPFRLREEGGGGEFIYGGWTLCILVST
jgi:hypothetical protein